MRSFQIIEGKPVFELHIEVSIGGKGMFEEKVIVDYLPKPLYLSIGLWSTNSGVFVDNRKLLKYDLKAMEMS